MKNLNYPTLESGIPLLLLSVVPDNLEYVTYWEEKGNRIGVAMSYMEILQWLRDKGYHIEIRCLEADENVYGDVYHWEIYKKTPDILRTYEMSSYQFTYHEALDEAIIYTLNLLKDE